MMSPAHQLHGLLVGPWAGMLELPLLFTNSLLWGGIFYLAGKAAVRPFRRGLVQETPR